ncbi:hypothetical protein NUW54_g8344 [Trametes sanguinea]|uniref:Uncharacterized protein n=1 Tax=Trametes sanguinea TaxID=158606 RepID=A0ACC1PFR6_9APHY|nr:hypothetical protein NUW54_g8344 [Trametes sanguinea]
MSDVEDENVLNSGDAVEDEHEEHEEERPRKHSRREEDEEDEEEEEEEDDEEDEDEEEDEEDEGMERGKKRAKHRHKRPAVNRFLDVEAEVDEDEEEEEDEDEYARDEFIADTGLEGEDDYDMVRRAADHARYDRRVREMDDRDLEQVAEDISQRYRRTAVRSVRDGQTRHAAALMRSWSTFGRSVTRCAWFGAGVVLSGDMPGVHETSVCEPGRSPGQRRRRVDVQGAVEPGGRRTLRLELGISGGKRDWGRRRRGRLRPLEELLCSRRALLSLAGYISRAGAHDSRLTTRERTRGRLTVTLTLRSAISMGRN